MTMFGRKLTAVIALAALGALGGCDKLKPRQAPDSENRGIEAPEPTPTEAPPPSAPVAPPTSVITNASEADSREAPPEPDAQTQDDADATGMTARINRDDTATNGVTTQP